MILSPKEFYWKNIAKFIKISNHIGTNTLINVAIGVLLKAMLKWALLKELILLFSLVNYNYYFDSFPLSSWAKQCIHLQQFSLLSFPS